MNPHISHFRAIELFRMCLDGDPDSCEKGNPLRPTFGTYLYGPPGCGKTHIMAAFALQLRNRLDKLLEGVHGAVESLIVQEYKKFTSAPHISDHGDSQRWVLGNDKTGTLTSKFIGDPATVFREAVKGLVARVANYLYQPTDILYLHFDDLCALHADREKRESSILALEAAPVVFIDDLYSPKDDPGRLDVARELIEKRYESGQYATFITSNVAMDDLMKRKNSVVANRIQSRCKELFTSIDFTGAPDWRTTVRARKNEILMAKAEERALRCKAAFEEEHGIDHSTNGQ